MIVSHPKEMIASFVSEKQGLPAFEPWVMPYATVGLMKDGHLVAGVVYNFYTKANCQLHVGAVEGKRWMTREFLSAVFDLPFNHFGLRRVTAITRRRAKAVRTFVENLGFVFEARINHYFDDDDGMMFGMLRENCRFLELRRAA